MHHTLPLRLARTLAVSSLALGMLAVSPVANAGGLFVPDNGASVLARGGNDISLLDTAYALQFNPAGLPFGNGLDVRVDLMVLNWGESFTPKDATATGSNSAPPTVAPMAMVSYRLPGNLRSLAFGIGAWGPPGVIDYKFPDPSKAPAGSDGADNAINYPTRYNNISQTTVVIFPTIGVGWRPIPQLSIGASFQYVYSSIKLSTSLVGLQNDPPSTDYDILARIDVVSKPTFTGTFGAVASPIPGLMIGLSGRPTIEIKHSGSLQVTLGETLKSLATISPEKPTADLTIKLPAFIRGGASYKWQRLTTSLELVWEKWSDNNQFTLTSNAEANALGMAIKVATPEKPITILNNWHDIVSTRASVGYDFLRPEAEGFLLQANVGGLYEPNAIPSTYQNLPYITGNMAGVSGGITFAWKGFGLTLAGLYLIPQSFDVTDSKVVAKPAVEFGSAEPATVGNGHYTTNIWMLGFGLSYHGLDEQI